MFGASALPSYSAGSPLRSEAWEGGASALENERTDRWRRRRRDFVGSSGNWPRPKFYSDSRHYMIVTFYLHWTRKRGGDTESLLSEPHSCCADGGHGVKWRRPVQVARVIACYCCTKLDPGPNHGILYVKGINNVISGCTKNCHLHCLRERQLNSHRSAKPKTSVGGPVDRPGGCSQRASFSSRGSIYTRSTRVTSTVAF